MSVRKVYQLLFDGVPVFVGSYAACMSAYDATKAVVNLLQDHANFEFSYSLVIAFQPD